MQAFLQYVNKRNNLSEFKKRPFKWKSLHSKQKVSSQYQRTAIGMKINKSKTSKKKSDLIAKHSISIDLRHIKTIIFNFFKNNFPVLLPVMRWKYLQN